MIKGRKFPELFCLPSQHLHCQWRWYENCNSVGRGGHRQITQVWADSIGFFFISQELQNDITILQIHEACWVLCISVGVEESAKGRHMDKSSCLVVGMWGKHWSVVHREKEGD